MLKVTIPSIEQYDEINNEFIPVKGTVLQLEHSLVSLSKWESRWCKPFLSKEEKTVEETLDYIACMTITQNVDPAVYTIIPSSIIDQVNKYMQEPMTATILRPRKDKSKYRGIITSDIIYSWMVALNIPFECQKWHLNRLITLISICNEQQNPPQKMSQKEIMTRNTALNEARRKALHTKG